MLSMTSDYVTDTGCPEPYLRRIAEAGFTHVHWCHQWNTDFMYADCELEQIAAWLRGFGLKLTDLHASAGAEKAWGSLREYERLAGVELVKNRIDMAERLGSDVIIMHLPGGLQDDDHRDARRDALRRSLDALRAHAGRRGVRIAIENGNFDAIEEVLAQYGPEYLGLCYDSGHANVAGDGLERLERLKDRLISIHLHDNDGQSDQHKLLFSGTVDWTGLARILAESSYRKCVSMETVMRNTGIDDEAVFLARAFETGTRFAQMVQEQRKSGGGSAASPAGD